MSKEPAEACCKPAQSFAQARESRVVGEVAPNELLFVATMPSPTSYGMRLEASGELRPS
jgi:hypothetical protein